MTISSSKYALDAKMIDLGGGNSFDLYYVPLEKTRSIFANVIMDGKKNRPSHIQMESNMFNLWKIGW